MSSGASSGASSVTVSPGDIEAFSKFMAAIAGDVEAMATEMTSLASAPDLGEYDKSAAALTRYQKAATAQATYAKTLDRTAEKLVAGTRRLAVQYRDLEDLNASGSATITAYLDAAEA